MTVLTALSENPIQVVIDWYFLMTIINMYCPNLDVTDVNIGKHFLVHYYLGNVYINSTFKKTYFNVYFLVWTKLNIVQ